MTGEGRVEAGIEVQILRQLEWEGLGRTGDGVNICRQAIKIHEPWVGSTERKVLTWVRWDQNQQGLWGPTKVGAGSGPTKGRSVLAQILFRIIMCSDNKKKQMAFNLVILFKFSTDNDIYCLLRAGASHCSLSPPQLHPTLTTEKDIRFRDLPPWTVPYYYYYYYYF